MPDIADPSHIPTPAVQRQDREVLIDEARRQHYGDQPLTTSALAGGVVGALAPPVLAALMDYQGFKNNPTATLPLSLAAAPVMAAAGMGTEALGRLLSRSLGPGFDRRRWHRDQDPHRLNPAIRLAPVALALMAGRALPAVYDQLKKGSLQKRAEDTPDLSGFDIGFKNKPKTPISNPFDAAPAKLVGSPAANTKTYTDLPTRVEQKLLPPDSKLKTLAPDEFRKTVGYNPALAPALPANPESWIRTHKNSPWVHQAFRQLQANNAFEDIPSGDPADKAAWLRQRIIGTAVDRSHPSLQGAPKAPWGFGIQQGWDDRDTRRMALRVGQADTMHNLRAKAWDKNIQDTSDRLSKDYGVEHSINGLLDLPYQAKKTLLGTAGVAAPPHDAPWTRLPKRNYESYGMLPGLGVSGVGINTSNVLEPSLGFLRKLGEGLPSFYGTSESRPDNTALHRASSDLPLWLTSTPQERKWVNGYDLLGYTDPSAAVLSLLRTTEQVRERSQAARNPLAVQAAHMYAPYSHNALKDLRISPRRMPEFKYPEDVPNADQLKKSHMMNKSAATPVLPHPSFNHLLGTQSAHMPVPPLPLRTGNWKTTLKPQGQFNFRGPKVTPVKAPDASAVVQETPGQPKMAASKTPAELKAAVQAAEAQVREPKSDKQRESGVYQKGHVTLHGLDITLETASGMTRSGTAKNGTKWSVTLKDPYGYIKGTDSAEPGDQMDVFIGPHPEIELVFVVDQNKHGTKTFDEVKVVMGVRTVKEARELYERNYSPGWDGFRSVTPLTIPQFKSWCGRGDMAKPLAGQQFMDFHKTAGARQLLARLASAAKRDPDMAITAVGGAVLPFAGALAYQSWKRERDYLNESRDSQVNLAELEDLTPDKAEALQSYFEAIHPVGADGRYLIPLSPKEVEYKSRLHHSAVKQPENTRPKETVQPAGARYAPTVRDAGFGVGGAAVGYGLGSLLLPERSEEDVSPLRRYAPHIGAALGAGGGVMLSRYLQGGIKVAATLGSAYNSPEVREYFQQREDVEKKRKEQRSWRLPLLGGGLLAAGHGLRLAGDAFISPEDRGTANDLIGLGGKLKELKPAAGGGSFRDILFPPTGTNKAFEGSPELFYDYIDRATRASKIKLYGKDVVEWLHKVKPMLGFNEDGPGKGATPAQIALHAENQQHYPSFQEGPVPAYLHQLRKLVKDPSWDIKWPNHYLRDQSDGSMPISDPGKFMSGLETRLDEFLGQHNNTTLADAGKLPHGEQMNALRRFAGHLQHVDAPLSRAADIVTRNASKMQSDAAGWYSNGGRMALGLLQDAPRALGVGLGVAGAGTLAYWLVNRLRNHKKPAAPRGWRVQEPEEREKKAGLPLSSLAALPSRMETDNLKADYTWAQDPLGAKRRYARLALRQLGKPAPASIWKPLYDKVWPTQPAAAPKTP